MEIFATRGALAATSPKGTITNSLLQQYATEAPTRNTKQEKTNNNKKYFSHSDILYSVIMKQIKNPEIWVFYYVEIFISKTQDSS